MSEGERPGDVDVDVGELLAAYAATAERWHELRSDARAANPVFDENARLAARLRESGAGRTGIARLMDHPDSGVRVLAAAHSLPDGVRGQAGMQRGAGTADFTEAAIAVLEELEAGAGLHAIAAAHALTEFRAGRLEL